MTGRSALRLLVGLAIAAACIWYFAREVDMVSLRSALISAEPLPIFAAAVAFVLTTIAKAFRWQLLFPPAHRIKLATLWAILMVGQVINMLSPVPRLGDLTRVVQLHQTAQISRAEVLGTLVSEKSFDLIFTAIVMGLLLPLITVPQLITNPFASITVITAILLLTLYLSAFQAAWVLAIFGRITALLPTSLESRLNSLAASMLRGFSSLSDPATALKLLLINCVIILFAVASPLFMLSAVGMKASWVTATLVHIAVSLGLSLPGAPARIGLFEGIVFAVFIALGFTDEAQILAYAVLFHAIIIVPTLLSGAVAALIQPKAFTLRSRQPKTT